VTRKKFHIDDPQISDITGPVQCEIILEYRIGNGVERNTGGSGWGNIPAFFFWINPHPANVENMVSS
jgi:hypothetical protein